MEKTWRVIQLHQDFLRWGSKTNSKVKWKMEQLLTISFFLCLMMMIVFHYVLKEEVSDLVFLSLSPAASTLRFSQWIKIRLETKKGKEESERKNERRRCCRAINKIFSLLRPTRSMNYRLGKKKNERVFYHHSLDFFHLLPGSLRLFSGLQAVPKANEQSFAVLRFKTS